MLLGLPNLIKKKQDFVSLEVEWGFRDFDGFKKSSQCIPKWFKSLPRDLPKSFPPDSTVKRCIPFMEAMTEGFTICLWSDLYINASKNCLVADDSNRQMTHPNGAPLMVEYDESPDELIGKEYNGLKIGYVKDLGCRVTAQFSNLSAPNEYFTVDEHSSEQTGKEWLKELRYPNVLKLNAPYKIKTPHGFSTYFKPPANDFSNHLKIVEGLVDTDRYAPETNFPFVWTGSEDGHFIIPSGTPIAQCIVLKRSTLKHEVSTYKKSELREDMSLFKGGQNRYRRFFWHKAKDNG